MCRCEEERMMCVDVKMWRCENKKKIHRPPLLDEPFAQTLSGKTLIIPMRAYIYNRTPCLSIHQGLCSLPNCVQTSHMSSVHIWDHGPLPLVEGWAFGMGEVAIFTGISWFAMSWGRDQKGPNRLTFEKPPGTHEYATFQPQVMIPLICKLERTKTVQALEMHRPLMSNDVQSGCLR